MDNSKKQWFEKEITRPSYYFIAYSIILISVFYYCLNSGLDSFSYLISDLAIPNIFFALPFAFIAITRAKKIEKKHGEEKSLNKIWIDGLAMLVWLATPFFISLDARGDMPPVELKSDIAQISKILKTSNGKSAWQIIEINETKFKVENTRKFKDDQVVEIKTMSSKDKKYQSKYLCTMLKECFRLKNDSETPVLDLS